MAEFMQSNLINIVLIVGFIALLLFLYKSGKKATVSKIILGLVVLAEKKLGGGTGELKYAVVIKELYNVLPSALRMLFSEKDIDKMIEDAVIKLKKILESGANLTGYDEERYIEELKVDEEADTQA